MNILVINGSPKGKNSITLQSMLYLEKKNIDHHFEFLHIGPIIRKLEKDFSEAKKMLEKAELIIFSYPVYTFLAPYQMHRFIELVYDNDVNVKDKWGTQITTSKHFYDITAHRFMNENMLDFGLKVLPGLSQDMEDLLKERGRKELLDWMKMTEFRIEMGIFRARKERAIEVQRKYEAKLDNIPKTGKKKISIVTNVEDNDSSLQNMIEDFRRSIPYEATVFNIGKFPFSGGCLGCFGCAKTGKCVHKDGFDSYLREQIQSADSIVYAFRIKHHFTASSMKCYDDRQFCNGHRTVTAGSPTAYIIAGDLKCERNLQDLIEARASVGGNFLAAIATDESDDTPRALQKAAESLSFAIRNGLEEPKTFFGEGGSRIFRDLIYEMQGLMKADHRFYRSHGMYSSFPQKHKSRIVMMKLVGLLMSLPGADKKKGMMTEGMLAPYRKVLDSAGKETQDRGNA